MHPPIALHPGARLNWLVQCVWYTGPRLAAFQAEMRTYMPAPHAELLATVEAQLRAAGTLAGFATAQSAPPSLRAAYADACKALAALRAFHLGIATYYLQRALKGTGGSDFRTLLDEGLASTREAAAAAAASRST